MLQIRRILCPTDFREASTRALDYAVPFAKTFGAELFLIHVIPLIPRTGPSVNDRFDVPEYERLLESDAKRQLSAFAEGVRAEIPTREIIGHGDPAAVIVKEAMENQIDLIVISAAGHEGLEHALLGGVTEKVVRRARCPVLSIQAAR